MDLEDLLREIPPALLAPLFLIMTGAVCFAMMRSHVVRLLGLTYFTARFGYEILFADFNYEAVTAILVLVGLVVFIFRLLFWLDDNSFSQDRIQMTLREFLFGYSRLEAERRVLVLSLLVVVTLLIGDLRLAVQV